jgi:hemerythrin-like domain-containing protein
MIETSTIDTLHEQHQHLRLALGEIRAAARELPNLAPGERSLLISRIVEYLKGTVLPEATVEEQGLYAEVRRVLADPKVTETMEYDHRAIEAMAEALAGTPVRWTESLQQLLYGIAALIELHIDKEERIYLELVEPAS